MPPLREQQFSSHITQLTKQDWRNSLVDAFIFYKWNQNSGPLGSILGLDILPALPAVKFNLPPLLNSFHMSSGQEIEGKPKQNTNSILFKKRHRNFQTTDNIFYLLQNFNQRDFLSLQKPFFFNRTGGLPPPRFVTTKKATEALLTVGWGFIRYNIIHYDDYISRVFLTDWQARFLKASLFSRHILAASTLAGDSVFGSASSDITDSRI